MARPTVDATSYVPRYLTIKSEIIRRIDDGELKVGDQIPSLREICEEFSVSSITARRALLDLLNEGVVERRGGLGAFVTGVRRRLQVAVLLLGYSEETWRLRSGHIGQLVGGIGSAAWDHEAILTIIPLSTSANAAVMLEQLLRDHHVDGFLVRGSAAEDIDPALLELADRKKVPTVLVKRLASDNKTSSVMPDARHAGEISVRRLVEAGHRHIGLIAATSSVDTYMLHREGFANAMKAAGLDMVPDLIQVVGPSLPPSGRSAAEILLRLADPPTGIITNSDLLAVGVYEAADSEGYAIPGDLSVLSFDDLELAEHLSPPLTTVRLSYYDLGRVAASRLLRELDGDTTRRLETVPVQLIERASVADPRTS